MSAFAAPPPVASPTPSLPVAAPIAAPPAPATTMAQVLDNAFAAAAPPAAPPVDPAAVIDPAAPVAPPVVDPAAPPAVDPNAPPPDAPQIIDPTAPIETPDDLAFVEIEPVSVSDDGKLHHFNKNKADRLIQDHRFVKELAQILPEVTVDAVKELHNRAVQAEQMMNMFRMSPDDPGMADQVLQQFQQADPHAFGVLGIRTLLHLPQVNPEAAKVVHRLGEQRVIDQAKARLLSISDPAQREAEVNFIQNLELRLNDGQFTPKEALLASQNVDPVTLQLQELQLREQRVQQWEQTQRKQAHQIRVQSIDGAEDAAAYSPIEDALKPLKANSAFKPEDIQDIEARLISAVKAAESSSPSHQATYNLLRTEAMRTGSPEAIAKVASFRQNIARMAIQQNSRAIIAARSQSVVAANQAAHTQAASAPRTENAPNGAVAPTPNGAIEAAHKSGSWDQLWNSLGMPKR